ncbi:hypothetical protein A3B51_03250 [Candidatus Curtissbacteria bacterium RIFCSPLOWO2_01_FULL_41_18]|uniref:TrpR, YerC/YecD n=2 Tax=Candidatus Curtissiibacteriota TaxID=1752717 RepID=A0A1F5G205_9BACT|nr:MAG: hypothetical protein A2696_03510 [Candidatus Curtissbacteria bacterium RIFCSPHIGHO2_01_FULL_41_13]OGE04777.1 MAG: hypothetical protein A3B51_03250 [Candidatus Curtissbacteria bacterium RIFCSPLOWO2_01_FULL_41_18]
MTKISRLGPEPKRMNQFIGSFWDAVTLLEERDEVSSFLKDLLTPVEIRMLSKRLQIAKMLNLGYDYQTISTFVRVTPTTISKVNSNLRYGSGGIDLIIRRLIKLDRQRQNKFESSLDKRYRVPTPLIDLTEAGINFTGKTLKRRSKKHSLLK